VTINLLPLLSNLAQTRTSLTSILNTYVKGHLVQKLLSLDIDTQTHTQRTYCCRWIIEVFSSYSDFLLHFEYVLVLIRIILVTSVWLYFSFSCFLSGAF